MASHKITVDAQSLPKLAGKEMGKISAAIDKFTAVKPVSRIEWLWKPEQGWYRYEVTFADGKIWLQQIITTPTSHDADPEMAFDVPITSAVRLSEFSPHREVRDELVRMTATIGLTKFVYEGA